MITEIQFGNRVDYLLPSHEYCELFIAHAVMSHFEGTARASSSPRGELASWLGGWRPAYSKTMSNRNAGAVSGITCHPTDRRRATQPTHRLA